MIQFAIPVRIRLLYLFSAVLAASATSLIMGIWQFTIFPLDDAYIHLSFGKNFSFTNLLSFNGDQPDTGSSSWIWAVLCIIIEQLRLPPYYMLNVCAMLFFSLMIWLSMELTYTTLPQKIKGKEGYPFITLALLVLNGNIIWLTYCGMETILLILLIFFASKRFIEKRGMDILTGIIVLIMIMTRIEAMVWVVGMTVFFWLLPVSGKRPWIGWLFPLLGLVIYGAYNLHYGVHVLPTSAFGKLSTFVPSNHNLIDEYLFLRYLFQGYIFNWLPGWGLAFIFWLLGVGFLFVGWSRILIDAIRMRDFRRLKQVLTVERLLLVFLLGGMIVHTLFLTIRFRSDYHHLRYFAPMLFFVAATAVPVCILFFYNFLKQMRHRISFPLKVLIKPVVILIMVIVLFGTVLSIQTIQWTDWKHIFKKNVEHLESVHVDVARWISNRLGAEPSKTRVACFDIGALKYFTDCYIIDLGGLISAEALIFRRKHDCAAYLHHARADYYVSLNNHIDTVDPHSPNAQLSLEHLKSWHYPDYPDASLTHSRRMEIYHVNLCGKPRFERVPVTLPIDFEPRRFPFFPTPDWGTSTGTSFYFFPSDKRRASYYVMNIHGNGFLNSYSALQQDAATGIWYSPWQKVKGNWLSFLYGGGYDPEDLRIELWDDSGYQIAWWTGFNNSLMKQIDIRISAYKGRRIQLRMVDHKQGDWGHLLLDYIYQFNRVLRPPLPCDTSSVPNEQN